MTPLAPIDPHRWLGLEKSGPESQEKGLKYGGDLLTFPYGGIHKWGYPFIAGWFIHPASRGVAAHTAGLFRSVRGAKGGFPRGGSPS
jgi:hypothetical protein